MAHDADSLPSNWDALVRSVQSLASAATSDSERAVVARVSGLLGAYEAAQGGRVVRATSVSPSNPSSSAPSMDAPSRAQRLVTRYLSRHSASELARRVAASPLARDLAWRNEAWKELLLGERAYIAHLVALYEGYVAPLKNRKKLLPDTQVRKIFQNIEELKELAKSTWKKVEAAARVWPEEEPRVGRIFLEVATEMSAQYAPYVQGFPEALKQLVKARRGSPDLERFVQGVRGSGGEGAALPLPALLMLPVVRLYEYEQLVKQLWELTPPTHPDYADLSEAKRALAALNASLLLSKAEAQKLAKVLGVAASLRDEPSQAEVRLMFLDVLVQEKAALVREGPLLGLHEAQRAPQYVFLFGDMLVVANHAGAERTFETYYSLVGASVYPVPPTAQHPHAFALHCANGRKVVFGAATAPEAASWVADLSALALGHAQDKALTQDKALGQDKPQDRDRQATLKAALSDFSAISNTVMERRNKALEDLPLPSRPFLRALLVQKRSLDGAELLEVVPPEELRATSSPPPSWRTLHLEEEHKERTLRIRSLLPLRRQGTPSGLRGAAWHVPGRTLFALVDGKGSTEGAQAATEVVRVLGGAAGGQGASDLRLLGRDLLRGLAQAHQALLALPHARPVSVFLGQLVDTLKGGPMLLVAAVGAGGAFVFTPSSGRLQEVALVSGSAPLAPPLGPAFPPDAPDLSTLRLAALPCQPEDIVLLLSEAILLNLDPERAGLLPPDLAPLFRPHVPELPSAWSDTPLLREARGRYRTALLTRLLTGPPSASGDVRVHVASILSHCEALTEPSRRHVDQLPLEAPARPPKDPLRFPGHLDHVAALALFVRKPHS